MNYQLHQGDNLDVLATVPTNSFDSLVTDPPAGIGSTGKGALLEGFRFYGIEKKAKHIPVATARCAHAALASL